MRHLSVPFSYLIVDWSMRLLLIQTFSRLTFTSLFCSVLCPSDTLFINSKFSFYFFIVLAYLWSSKIKKEIFSKSKTPLTYLFPINSILVPIILVFSEKSDMDANYIFPSSHLLNFELFPSRKIAKANHQKLEEKKIFDQYSHRFYVFAFKLIIIFKPFHVRIFFSTMLLFLFFLFLRLYQYVGGSKEKYSVGFFSRCCLVNWGWWNI